MVSLYHPLRRSKEYELERNNKYLGFYITIDNTGNRILTVL